jgi:enoyl-[acyl-carrier protein] reductase III
METNFYGKRILITGGTKGLGFSTAQLFAKQGTELFLTYRSDETNARNAANLLTQMGATRCEVIQSDLSEDGSINLLFDQISSKTSHLDIYIHNAAATAFKDLLEIKSHHIDKTLNITVKGFILGVQRSVQLMKNGGSIIAVSGMDTLKAVPRHGLLGAAKSAIETLVSYYAHELASRKIQVNGINPGFFETDSTRKYLGPFFNSIHKQIIDTNPLKQAARLEDIGNVILFLCSEQARWVVGQTLCVDGGSDFALPFNFSTPELSKKNA